MVWRVWVEFFKVKVKVKVTLQLATKAQRWSKGISLLFFNLGAR
jgi:hypothetical protein